MGTLTFYFDRCFGKRFPRALETLQPPFKVEYHHNKRNRFKQDMDDDEWLAICGQRKWVAFSHDKKFDDRIVEAAAIKQNGVMCFALCGGSALTWWKMLYFIKAYDKIIHVVKTESPPYLYRTSLVGSLQRVELP